VPIPKALLVTNDFPPRVGGIQRTLEALWLELPPDRVGVFAPSWAGCEAYDEAAAFPIVREPQTFVWPTPRVASRIDAEIERQGTEVVLFGDALPLAALGPRLASRGVPYLVAAHGFDHWSSIVPGPHALMRYMTSRASRVAVMCSRFVARTVRTAVPRQVPVSVLYPGADLRRFRPDVPTEALRERYGLRDRPVVVCVSRLVTRKGQDVLIRSMTEIRQRAPDATLLIVGGGPAESRLRAMAADAPSGSVVFAGQVDEQELPGHYAMADVFAMPCRTRLAGMEVEGWGNVFIEAAACGRPVVVGDSGGARESLVDGETGILVDGRDRAAVAAAVGDLLADPARAARMGRAGRERVERDHDWAKIAATLAAWLEEAAA
jgi:phosphatidylinositol alpha-1,6-mannosyltransferase